MFDPDAVKVWYEEALRQREETLATIDELRVRSGTLLTVAALVTTLFATLASSSHRQIADSSLEQAAIASFIFLALLLGIVLMPMFEWACFARPGRVRRMVISNPPPTGTEMREYQARKIPKDVEKDRGKLAWLQRLFVLASLALVAEVTLFSVAIL